MHFAIDTLVSRTRSLYGSVQANRQEADIISFHILVYEMI